MFKKNPNKESKIKLAPKSKPTSNKPMVAFDVGSKTTKLVMGRFKGSRVVVDIMNGTVNTKGCSFDGKIQNINEMQRIIKKLILASKIKLSQVVFTVESTSLIRREMDVPPVPEQDMLGLITFELGQYLPIDISSYVLQVKQIGSFTEDGVKKKKVAVAALPKDITEAYVNFSDSLQFERNAMDINSNALEKLITLEISVNAASEFKKRNVVFIDMGHSFFNISIYSDGKYLFNKIVPIGGGMVDEAIANRKRISEEEAERIKISNAQKYSILDLMHKFSRADGKPTSNDGMVLYETLSIYDTWANEIGQVLKYYTTRDRKNTIDEIYLYGGCSFIKGIDQYFERKLQLPTNTFVNFKSIETSSNEVNRNILNYLNAVGALIRS